MTRGLMFISSTMPGWIKKSTCSRFRTHLHLFQELGITKEKSPI